MSNIFNVDNALEGFNLEINREATESQRPEVRPETRAEILEDDTVNINTNALNRVQQQYNESEPISKEQAMQALEAVQSATADELAGVHQGLDANRVFQLLGME